MTIVFKKHVDVQRCQTFRFFRGITDDQSVGCLNSWNESRNYKEKIYISYDSIKKNSYFMTVPAALGELVKAIMESDKSLDVILAFIGGVLEILTTARLM